MGRNLGKGVTKFLLASSSSSLLDYPVNKMSLPLVSRIGLGNFSSESHHTYSICDANKLKILKQRQVELETRAWKQKEKFYKEVLEEEDSSLVLPHVKSTFMEWFKPLRDAIQADIDPSRIQIGRPLDYEPHLSQLSPDLMAVITMHQLMLLLIDDNAGIGRACAVQAAFRIGHAIEHDASLQKKMALEVEKEHDEFDSWGEEICVKVGARMIDLLIKTATVKPPLDDKLGNAPPARPAFSYHTKKLYIDDKFSKWKYGCIECDHLVEEGLEKIGEHIVVTYMPMLIPPRNWTRYNQGAYLFLPSYVVKPKGSKKQHPLKQAPNKQLEPIFEALNMLGSTKWRINDKVLDVVDRIRDSGGRMPFPVECLPEECERRAAEMENLRKFDHIGLKLAVAHKMKEEEGFYFPHNLDFRGRAYPLHPHLNHYGPDLSRGLLEFSDGKPLGKSGLRWLKIHLANLYGNDVKKKTYEARVKFTDTHIENIHDSANDPLGGKKWWLDAEKPYQCLAVCINLSDALKNPFPETTISHIPVHQDGTFNGLQHYAALKRDMLEATAVNLVRNEEPSDVYSQIASKVREIMRQDAELDPKKYPYAEFLITKVDRKLVKETVMTSLYGVTYCGARGQIMKRMKDRGIFTDDKDVFQASLYATKTTLTAVGERFTEAKTIMNWLGDCAKIIAKENKPIAWTTPFGLPVVQPYHEFETIRTYTRLQKFNISKPTEKVLVKKQVASFAPNFVHYLDASHMMMTAVACNRAGMSFAVVGKFPEERPRPKFPSSTSPW